MFDHFIDTILLLGLEFVLALVVQLAAQRISVADGLVEWVQLITKWMCISTLMLFCVEFLALFVVSSVVDIKEGSMGVIPQQPTRKNPELGGVRK